MSTGGVPLVHRTPPEVDDPEFDPAKRSVRDAVNQLEEAIGGRPSLIQALSTSEDVEAGYLLGLVADPRNDGKTLATLCYQANITPAQLLRTYRSAVYAKAQVLAIHEVASAAQPVTRDLMRRAQNHYRICDACHGTGVECKRCGGSGEILVDASLDHQRIALDLLGLLPKGGGPNVTQVNQFASSVTATGVLPFTTLQLAVQQILREEPPPPQLKEGTRAAEPVAPVVDAVVVARD